jgi:hypothetical protein
LLLTRTRHRAVLYWFVSGRSDGTAPSPSRPSPSTSGGETPKRSSKKSELLCPTCLPLSIHCAVRLVYAFILTQYHLVHCVFLHAQEQARAQLHRVGAKRRRLSVIRPRAMRAPPRPKKSEAHLVSHTFSLLCSARPPPPPTQPHLRIHAFAHSTSLRRSCAPRCSFYHSLSLSHSRLLHSCSHALCFSSAGIHPTHIVCLPTAGATGPKRGGLRSDTPKSERSRGARVWGDQAQQMIINVWTELKISYRGDRRKGGLFNYIAKLLGVGSRTVERVIGAHKARCREAMDKGIPQEDVKVPKVEPETRERASPVTDKHIDFVVATITRMVYDQELEVVPSVR